MNKNTPIYWKVYSELKESIVNDYNAGDLFLTETEIIKKYNVSRITVRHAMQLLKQNGFVSIRQGSGTVVTKPELMHNISYIISISENLKAAGYSVTYKDIQVDKDIPPHHILTQMEITEKKELTRIQRVYLADDKPIGIGLNYTVFDVDDSLYKYIYGNYYLYTYLEKEHSVIIDHVSDTITASNATKEQAEKLGVPVGASLLRISRITRCGGKVITYDRVDLNANRYAFSVDVDGQFHSTQSF